MAIPSKPVRAGLLASCLVIVMAEPGWGQPARNPVSAFDTGFGFSMGFRYEDWKEDGEGVSAEPLKQFTSYLLVNQLFASGLRVDVQAGWCSTDQESFDRLSTFRDTKLSLSQRIGEHFTVAGGVNVPTGKTSLDFSGVVLAQRVASRIKGFSTPKFGEGLNFNGRVVYGFKLNAAHMSFGLGFLNKGKYDLSEAQENYDPGDQVTGSAGIDHTNDTHSWRSQADYTHYGADRTQDKDVFQFGDRVRLESAYSRTSPDLFWQARGRAYFQQSPDNTDSLMVLEPEAAESRDWEFYVDLGLDRRITDRWHLLGSAGVRLLGERSQGGGDGHRFDISAGVRVPLSLFSVSGRGRYSWGSLAPAPDVPDQDDINVHGYALELAFERRPW